MRTGNARTYLAHLLLALLATPVSAQVLQPPIVHWIGPQAQCDYHSIQEALDDIFDCGNFACLPGRNQLRLSANYVHSGPIEVRRTFDILGGFGGACGESIAGPLKVLGDAGSGNSLVVVLPGTRTINNVFTKLILEGADPGPIAGGVIEMRSGDATLTLDTTIVRNGDAVSGGGVYLAGNGNQLVLDNSFIEDNQAIQGGGVYCTQGGVIDFQNGRIEDNIAVINGGGIYLQSGCHLKGTTPGVNRQILRNSLTDIQRGEGAGIYALSSRVEMGALFSLTQIDFNVVPAFIQTGTNGLGDPSFDHHRYDEAGNNRGGGVHLEHSRGTFYNTWFRFNEASDGGAISAIGGSTLLVDRTSGPCVSGDTGQTPHCSLFQGNRARGGKDTKGDEGGDGAVLVAEQSQGFQPAVRIRRSLWTGNAAGCFEASEPDFEGECNLGSSIDLTYEYSTTSVVHSDSARRLEVSGNLISGNSVGDATDCGVLADCFKEGFYFDSYRSHELIFENSITRNGDADAFFDHNFSGSDFALLNNLIIDPEVDDAIYYSFTHTSVSSCNISNFADELNTQTNSSAISSVDFDPLFVDSDNGDFRVQVPASPAIDRCDDSNGLINSTYDILGNPRPLNIEDVSHGPGRRDVGAFEAVPVGFVNDTTDLVVDIQSDLPKTAELGEDHPFYIEVTNRGRNAVTALHVDLDLQQPGGFLASVSGAPAPDGAGGLTPTWDCDSLGSEGRCTYIGAPLNVGASTTLITARISYGSEGQKKVTATVILDDAALTELTLGNDKDSDTVTVGPGADLEIQVAALPPGEIAAGQPQQFTIAIHNNGPEVADGVEVNLEAFDGQLEQLNSLGASDWTCNFATAVCTLGRVLDILQNEPDGLPTVFAVNVSSQTPGLSYLSARVTAGAGPGDPEFSNNSDSDSFVVLRDDLFADGFED